MNKRKILNFAFVYFISKIIWFNKIFVYSWNRAMKFPVFVNLNIEIIERRICSLAQGLPSNVDEKSKIVERYARIKGYEFLKM